MDNRALMEAEMEMVDPIFGVHKSDLSTDWNNFIWMQTFDSNSPFHLSNVQK